MRDGAERHLWALALLLGQRGSTSWELADGTPIDAHAHLHALVGLMPAREREQLVERCWTLAGAAASLLCALGWAEIREDVLARSAGLESLDRRAGLYALNTIALGRLAENLEREHDELLDELAARWRHDLDEATIAEAAYQEDSTRRYNAGEHSWARMRCPTCAAPCGSPCLSSATGTPRRGNFDAWSGYGYHPARRSPC